MKNFIKMFLKKFTIYSRKELNNYIILESNPDLEDNAYAFYKTLLKHQMNKKYKIFWFVTNKDISKNITDENVFVEHYYGNKNKKDKRRQNYIIKTAKFIIDSNKRIYKKNKNQIRVHLTHGMPIKSVPHYFVLVGKFDYITATSKEFGKILARDTKNKLSTVITLGLPRNEMFLNKINNLNKICQDKEYKKLIIWLPTYRQRKDGRFYLKGSSPFGIPAIENIEDLNRINEELQKKEILILFKPHPAQDISIIKAKELSNFLIISDDDLQEHNIKLYELLSTTDALITDYSSVYVDYLLLDKPIGITVDDINVYKNKIGFVFENVYDILKGEHIKNTNDIIGFINDVSNNIDRRKKERDKVKQRLHENLDLNASERLYQFLKDNENL